MGKNTNIALNNSIIVLPYNDNSDSFLDDALSVFLRIKINDKNFEWRFDDSLIIFKF